MLTTQISSNLREALKDKNTFKVSVLRMLSSALHNEAIALKKKEKGLDEDEEIKVLKREVKKRKEAIEAYTKGSRPELAAKEKEELEILEKYLPVEMSEDEIRKVVKEILAGLGEVLSNQFGQVMAKVMTELKGKADGAMVSRVVREMMTKKE
jgi:uncharacterized protein YqeY